jgi:hypothetical protein
MNIIARSAGLLLALVFTAALVVASRLPWQVHGEDEAQIRLSWRTVSEPLRECRKPTPEELAALPLHMRMEEICERRHAPFRLAVRIDGATVRDALREPAGARGDRPLYVFEEIPVPPGPHRIEVEFHEELDGGARRAPLRLSHEVRLAPREIALITLDASGDQLVLGRSPTD